MNSLCVWEPQRNNRWRALFDMDEQTQARLARLEVNVEHIQQDVGDIKAQLVRMDQKIDGLREDLTDRIDGKVDGLRADLTDKIDGLRQNLTDRIDGKVDGLRADLTGRIDGMRADLTGKIDGVRADLTGKIDGVRQELYSMKVWAMGMYIALAGTLLVVMAKGFKWL